ncbi:glycosyltransferases group 1 [Indivirus ILV1]|uniref:Glycosyltransferases group 1 n=1 Tax=Indivirus ILV1 TaxID=1977633 RepID=A0A1V0SD18_9VIRU|nr:glycosyltransferases group 1 [Indivirus ILV1]
MQKKTQARLIQESKFKPKRIILNGIPYNVDSLDKLEKIKDDLRAKKEYADELADEQKNQKVLITKTRMGSTDQRITKVITDMTAMPDRNKKRVVQPTIVKEPEKQKFVLKSNLARILVKPSEKIISDDHYSISSSFQKDSEKKEEQCKLNVCNPETSSTLKVKSHPRKEIKKLNKNQIIEEDTNPTCENNEPEKKFLIVTHERKPIPKDGLISQEESYTLRFGNDSNQEKQQETKQEEINEENIEKKSKINVVSNSNKIKKILTKRVNEPKNVEIKNTENKNEMNKIEDTFINLALNTAINEKRSPVKKDDSTINEIKEVPDYETNVKGFYNEQYPVVRSEWYMVDIKSRGNNEGLIKILDDTKMQLIPSIKINNDMFIHRKYDNKINEYRIYVKTLENSVKADIYIIGLDIINVKFQQTSSNIVQKNIDLWKMRKLYDLEFINYYLSNLKFDCSEKFIEKFNADYKLFKNENLLNDFINGFKIDLTSIPHDEEYYENGKVNVLYLMNSSIEYEENGYTIRSQNILKNFDDKYHAIGVLKYGYPYDMNSGYYKNKPEETFIYDGIKYFKLLNDTDNYNSNNIIDYLKKYIVSVIKLAVKTNAKIIYGVSDYLNGLVAMYSSKFLNIKSVYEVRGFEGDIIMSMKPELKGSNIIKMMTDQEQKIIKNVDLIITNNQILGDKILEIINDKEKLKIIGDFVDTEKFKPDENKRKELREKYNITNEIVIGYIGSISNCQGIEYILECLKLLLGENKLVKFALIGSGSHEDYINNYIEELELGNHVINIGEIDYNIINEYYNMMDIMIYPKKNYEWCKYTCSYKTIEAMSMGKAIIMSNFMKQDCVISIEQENRNDLFEKIKMMIADPEKIKNYGDKARQWILENKKNSKIELFE